MIVQGLVFYVLSAVLVGSGVMVIASRNPVHSVLWLILAFFNAAGLFLLLGAEFLAMVLVVVYVGAVAVLFLFVVMMLDVNLARLRQGVLDYMPLGAAVGLILLAELVIAGGAWQLAPAGDRIAGQPVPPMGEVANTEALGRLLYTDYVYLFEAAGVILLVGMIGAILLTLRHKDHVRRQDIGRQTGRVPEETVSLRKVSSGEGVG